MKPKVLTMVAVLALIATLAAQCAAPATPQTIVQTVVVEKEKVVTKEVEKQVVVTQEVEKEVVVTKEVEKEVLVTATPEAMPYEGVEVNILTFTGPQIAEPLQRRGPDFGALTGAKINVIVVPFNELYQKLLTDMATGTNSFDAFVFAPQWMVDYITPGYLEDMTDRIANDSAIEWEDVAPFFRDFSASFQGRIYTIPLDGDFHMGYYRTDLLQAEGLEPPKTWDEYLQVAATFHGKDLNGDGDPDYGSCISKKRGAQAYWFITDFAASMIQSQGTSQGTFFNPDTMEPLVKNAAFQKALELYSETTQYGPPDELNLDVGDTRSLFTSGRCALSLDWGDIGTLAIDPQTSTVQDKTGAMILPGSTEVLDWETGELVPCDETTCPYAVDGVNHAPFASYGGWSGGINAAADPVVKDAAYAFFSYMSQPAQSNVDVTIGKTGFNPYRTSQFLNRQQWVEAGMSPQAASDYLGAIEASLASPNMVLDLRVPQNQRYQGVVLDQTVSQYLAGEITVEEAMQQIYDGWEEITDELGRDEQGAAYRGSLGVTK